jgi:hypothetical protein
MLRRHDILTNAFAERNRFRGLAATLRFPNASSPGAVSRYGLAPVRRAHENTCTTSLSSASSNDFCNTNFESWTHPYGLFASSHVLPTDVEHACPLNTFALEWADVTDCERRHAHPRRKLSLPTRNTT